MKAIVETAVRRKVTVIMVTIAVMVFGVISLMRLKTNLLPELTYPSVTIKTEYLQAAPSEVESLITKPLEEALGIVKNIRRISSTSSTGISEILLEFNWGTDIDLAIMDIREKTDAVELPFKAKRPIVLRFDPSFEPVIRIGAVAVDEKSRGQQDFQETLSRLRLFSEESVKKSIDTVAGVAAVKVSGGLKTNIQVQLDQQKLARHNLTLEAINSQISSENIDTSGGILKEGDLQFLLKSVNRFKTIDDIEKIVISNQDGIPVLLKDISLVRKGFKKQKAITRLNGEEAVEIAVYKEGDANIVAVATSVLSAIEQIEKTLPADIRLEVLSNQAIFIQNAVSDVMVTGIIGGILAVIILYTFLKNLWATIIISFSIPVSVIATFNLMYGNNVTLNIMSLGGITLGIGMLLDNSIVVLENVHRHLEKGVDAVLAATKGAGEVISAVTASTLTTIAVFFPMVFVEGIAGQLFRDQALTITFSLVASLLVALTLIPMLAALGKNYGQSSRASSGFMPGIVKKRSFGPGKLFIILVKGLLWLLKPVTKGIQLTYSLVEKWYMPLLRWSLKNKAVVLSIGIGMFAGTLFLVPKLGVELIPAMAQNEFKISIELPPGTPIRKTDEVIAGVQKSIAEIPEVKSSFSMSGSGNRFSSGQGKKGENKGEVSVLLATNNERPEYAVIGSIRAKLQQVPGIDYKIKKPSLFSLRTPLEIEISGFNLDLLKSISNHLVVDMSASGLFKDIRSSVDEGQPELQIRFDKDKLASLGLQAYEIAQRIMYRVQGNVPTKFSDKEQKIDIHVNAVNTGESSLNEINRLVINPEHTNPLSLDSVSTIKEATSPGEIKRIDQNRVAVISADYTTNDLGTAVKGIHAIIDELVIPPGITIDVSGQNQEMEKSFASLKMALLLAVFLVYLVMASQFESFIHPLVILFSIPLSLIGAVLALYLTGSKISVIVFIGAILLAGIVVNNAIVLIDKINQLRAEGSLKLDAIMEAGRMRLRPILMTTLTTALGLIPMALGVGEGSEIRSPMAVTVIGGLLGSTLLTLVIIPTVYSLVDRRA